MAAPHPAARVEGGGIELIYLIRAGEEFVKIGRSRAPGSRLKQNCLVIHIPEIDNRALEAIGRAMEQAP